MIKAFFGGLIHGARGGGYIRVEKRVTNLGGLYSGELIQGGGGLIYGILRYPVNDFKLLTVYPKTPQPHPPSP